MAKQQSKGVGYVRSSHMKADVGPTSGKGGGAGQKPHTNQIGSGESKGHGSNHKLPMEKHVGFNKGIVRGDNFEQEMSEHFPGKKGVAGMHKTAMPHKDSPVTEMSTKNVDGHGHTSGKAEHHGHMGPAYNFPNPSAGMSSAHGFGHTGEQKCGVLRNSGHKGAHRVGKR